MGFCDIANFFTGNPSLDDKTFFATTIEKELVNDKLTIFLRVC